MASTAASASASASASTFTRRHVHHSRPDSSLPVHSASAPSSLSASSPPRKPHPPSRYWSKLRNHNRSPLFLFLLPLVVLFLLLRHLLSPTPFDTTYVDSSSLSRALHSAADPTRPRDAPPLPSYAALAPRHPLFSLISARAALPSLNASLHSPASSPASSVLPHIHLVLVCHTPCCTSTLYPSALSAVSQTLPPTRLTFIHSCSSNAQPLFHREARRALADPSNLHSSYNLRPHVLFHLCRPSDPLPCIFDYLAHIANSVTDSFPRFTFLLTDNVLLEPTALEKAWLSFLVRPHLTAIRLQSYDLSSLENAHRQSDPLLIHPIWPSLNLSIAPDPFVPVPLMYNTATYRAHTPASYVDQSPFSNWLPLIATLHAARLIREPLCTVVTNHDPQAPSKPLFSFASLPSHILPPHLFSELAFHKWSARHDEGEMYTSPPPNSLNIQLDSIPHWPVRDNVKRHLMIVVPWMQMGGSEKCMLDIAAALIQRDWGVSFVMTMPFWAEEPAGELYTRHEWLSRTIHLTSDVFDILALGPDQKASRVFRYLLESRHPDVVLMSNSRWAYSHAALIKAVLPSTVVVDYNHMIHMSWEGGGMPRFGANNSAFFDLHLTASHDVSKAMRSWIKPDLMKNDEKRVQTCYIGTDSSLLRSVTDRPRIRQAMRDKYGISESAIVVLFAGRFVVDKGIDVAAEVVKQAAKDKVLGNRVAFVFIGSGDQRDLLTSLPERLPDSSSAFVVVLPPVAGLHELRDFYAMSDIFILPSVNEGIALVVYEAMADGLLVITTDVGGQREVVTEKTGILLPNYRTIMGMANHTVESLRKVVQEPDRYSTIRRNARELMRTKYTTKEFTNCVIDHIVRVSSAVQEDGRKVTGPVVNRVSRLRAHVARGVHIERFHGKWNRDVAQRSIEGYVTIGIKTYVCDETIANQVHNLVRSIRAHHPKVRVLLGNDGPTALESLPYIREDPYTQEVKLPEDSGISYGRNVMVNLTATRFFLLLDDDHVFDDTTSLQTVINALRQDAYDMVGLRVRNLPGIDEYERIGILIPRYVALIRKLEGMDLTLCVWNENAGPSVYGITHPIAVDVLHNAFMASTDILRRHPWRNELKVNEHMSFFLDAKDANLTVGYLPSVFVHHRARDYSDCYYKVRFREDKFRKLLRYKDSFLWDIECGKDFPNRVKKHILLNELDSA